MKELQNLTPSNSKKLLVILPIKKVNDIYLNECAYSLAQQTYPIDLLILHNGSEEELNSIKSIMDAPSITVSQKNDAGEITNSIVSANNKINYCINSTTSSNFQELFNEGFNYASDNEYELFSIIEPEDSLDAKWYSNAIKYSDSKPDKDGFMPLMREVSNGNFVGFFNEACWFEAYAEEAGTFDLQLLMRFNCINITSSVFRTKSLEQQATKIGDTFKILKENFKISYGYEFFLRMIYNDLKFYTIPRLGYEHRVDIALDIIDPFSSKIPRNIAQIPIERGGISPEELKYWLDAAKKEYFISRHDRVLKFEPKPSLAIA
jgi:hypothetical protein